MYYEPSELLHPVDKYEKIRCQIDLLHEICLFFIFSSLVDAFIAFGWCKIIISWAFANFFQEWNFHRHVDNESEKIDLSSGMIHLFPNLQS